jgi:chorismate dehydratase
VHGQLLEVGPPPSVQLVHGVPGQLNALLERGAIDVAPASSIEYGRHADRYRALPGLSISANGPVRTIQFLTRVPIEQLTDDSRIAIPTSSATSVVLLKIILTQRVGIRPEYSWFDQESEDPLASGADGALFIGDIAHRQSTRDGLSAHDLGSVWQDWTGLPFVFALWQTATGRERDEELTRLTGALHASRDWSMERLPELAGRLAAGFGWTTEGLLDYWRSLEYGWNAELAAGLQEFFKRAAELGALQRAPAPSFVEV